MALARSCGMDFGWTSESSREAYWTSNTIPVTRPEPTASEEIDLIEEEFTEVGCGSDVDEGVREKLSRKIDV